MKHILILLGALGCTATYLPSMAVYPAPEPVVIPTTPDSVWPAVVDVVTENQLSIETIDRASGLLQTSVMRTRGAELWDCGKEKRPRNLTESDTVALADAWLDVRITVSAVPRSGETLLRVSANPDVGYRQCKSKGVWETQFAQKILGRWRELR